MRSRVLAAAVVAICAAHELNASCKVPSFTSTTIPIPSGSIAGLAVGDNDRNGSLDLHYTTYAGGTLGILYGTGSGFSAPLGGGYPVPTAGAVALGNFDGNAVPDAAVTSLHSVYIVRLDGSGYGITSVATGSTSTPNGVAVADFNGDGKDDIAVADYTGTVYLFVGDGAGGFTGTLGIGAGGTPFDVKAADMNLDGKADWIVSNSANHTVDVYLGNGSGGLSSIVELNVTGAPKRLVVGDFNGDGRMDVAVALSDLNEVAVAWGAGVESSYTLTGPTYYSVGAGAWAMAAADVTGDGLVDLIATNSSANTISVLPGVIGTGGTRTFGPAVSFATGNDPVAIVAVDANRDGKTDLVVGDFNSQDVTYFQNNCVTRGGDANGDGAVTAADIFYLINYLFTGGAPPVQ